MTSASTIEDRHQQLRLRLKPKALTTGSVDGAWWPRSRDLATELPALLAVLAVRLGPIGCVSYNLTAWDPSARKLTIDNSVVRLAGYRTQHADTVDLIGAQQRVTLLVVPPETPAQAAHQVLMTAGHRGNTDDIDELLTPHPFTPHIVPAGGDAETAEQGWERDGGRVYQGL